MTSNPWEIGRPADVCAATGQPIRPGDEFVAALIEKEDGVLERLDYHVDAWAEADRPDHLFAFWQTVRSSPDARRQPLLDASTISDLFEQLADATEPRRLAFRFVLALILIRKRALEHVGQKPAAGGDPALMLVRFRGTDKDAPPLEVVDPQMDADTIIALSEQIQTIMALDD